MEQHDAPARRSSVCLHPYLSLVAPTLQACINFSSTCVVQIHFARCRSRGLDSTLWIHPGFLQLLVLQSLPSDCAHAHCFTLHPSMKHGILAREEQTRTAVPHFCAENSEQTL